MSKIIPSTYTPPTPVNFASGEPILLENDLSVNQALHYVWNRRPRTQLVSKTFNPVREVDASDVTFTQDAATGFDGLWTLDAAVEMKRISRFGTVGRFFLELVIVGRDLDVELTFDPLGAGSSSTVTVAGGSGSFAVGRGSLNTSVATGRVSLRWRCTSGGSSNGFLAHVGIIESQHVSAARLPDGSF